MLNHLKLTLFEPQRPELLKSDTKPDGITDKTSPGQNPLGQAPPGQNPTIYCIK